jgi:transposase-like protein
MDNVSLKNFYKRFPNEEACLMYLERLRWPEVRMCPHCKSDRTYKYANGKMFKCASCRKQFTAVVGTVFMKSHVPLQEWFLAVELCDPEGRGITSIRLAEYLGVTQKTAWSMLRRIRYGLSREDREYAIRLAGSQRLEADDVFSGSMRKLAAITLPENLGV